MPAVTVTRCQRVEVAPFANVEDAFIDAVALALAFASVLAM